MKRFLNNAAPGLRMGLASLAIIQLALGDPLPATSPDTKTQTPIKHVIVIIGENRSFDHVFATYQPKSGQTVWNLLSEGIVKADGTAGPNFAKAAQSAANDLGTTDSFLLSPPKTVFPNNVLPAPLAGGPTPATGYVGSLANAIASENGLPASYYPYLASGGTGLPSYTPDTRIKGVTGSGPDYSTLAPGPFQLTNGTSFTYNAYAASPVHRFYQMWQQLDCSTTHITSKNPSGCDASLFPWVEVTVGAGDNGLQPPPGFSTEFSPTGYTTGEGSTSMGFYNVQQGDAPYLKMLADNYAMSDNMHQAANGGTGANHIMLGHGDAIYFTDGNGNALEPPHNQPAQVTGPNAGIVDEVENPNPAANTNNWYTEDGYGGGSYGSASYGGGSYTNCSDVTQPGVAPIANHLNSIGINRNCEPGHYYLLNNYNPGYFGNGNNAFLDANPNNTVFTIPPSAVPSIGDKLLSANISWKYYGDQWNNYVNDPYQLNYYAAGAMTDEYCNICNPFQYDTSIMANATVRTAHIQDTANLYADIANGTLPAVSFVKPSGLVDGHPASSKLNLFEGFTQKIVDAVKANPSLWQDTAIFITFDEGGGYYDSGYVQLLDYFGDGTRIPLIVVSPYTVAGHISHEYADHVSILKFIEKNWGLSPVTSRSRDNMPNPIAAADNPYVPVNSPAISDLVGTLSFNCTYSGGNLTISEGQNCAFNGGTINGNVQLNGGYLSLINTSVTGNVQLNGGGTFNIGSGATIQGNLQIQNIPAGSAPNSVCGTQIHGNLQFQNNGTGVLIGSGAPGCSGNTINGDLQIQNNTGATTIWGNAVNGNLQDQNNTGATKVFNNKVSGNLQCNNDSSITGGGNTAKQNQCML